MEVFGCIVELHLEVVQRADGVVHHRIVGYFDEQILVEFQRCVEFPIRSARDAEPVARGLVIGPQFTGPFQGFCAVVEEFHAQGDGSKSEENVGVVGSFEFRANQERQGLLVIARLLGDPSHLAEGR